MKTEKRLTEAECTELIKILKKRFEKNKFRHEKIDWETVQTKLESCLAGTPDAMKKLWSLNEMEQTGGEPDVIGADANTGEIIFFDCALESPKGRRSLCYDREAQESRKDYPPKNNVLDMANAMGIELLTETQYYALQQLGKFDTKTSSWIQTPLEVRELGGAIFADYRYGRVFVYHNGAQSYYAARGFRGMLRI